MQCIFESFSAVYIKVFKIIMNSRIDISLVPESKETVTLTDRNTQSGNTIIHTVIAWTGLSIMSHNNSYRYVIFNMQMSRRSDARIFRFKPMTSLHTWHVRDVTCVGFVMETCVFTTPLGSLLYFHPTQSRYGYSSHKAGPCVLSYYKLGDNKSNVVIK